MWLLRVKTKVKSSFQNFDVCLKNAKYRVMVIKRLVWDFYTKCLSSDLWLFKVNTGVKHFFKNAKLGEVDIMRLYWVLLFLHKKFKYRLMAVKC